MAFHHHRTSFIKYRLHCGLQHGADASCFFHFWTIRFKIVYKVNRLSAYQTRAHPVFPRGIGKIFPKELLYLKNKVPGTIIFSNRQGTTEWYWTREDRSARILPISGLSWVKVGAVLCPNRLVSSVFVCTFVLCYEYYTVRSKNVCHERGFIVGIKECRVELSKKICVWSVRNHRCFCSSIHVPSPRVE